MRAPTLAPTPGLSESRSKTRPTRRNDGHHAALGSWRVRDGRLSITEEGRDYPVDVLELGADVFRIRIRGPGEPVEIRFAPAEQVVVPLERSAQP